MATRLVGGKATPFVVETTGFKEGSWLDKSGIRIPMG
jgi:hypothetical protein